MVSPKQWVLVGPSGAQRVHPCSAHTAKCHQWCAPGPNGRVVWPLGGLGAGLHCWLLWRLWGVCPMQQVLGSPSGPQGVGTCAATSASCHQWCALGPSGSVWPLGGCGQQLHCWLLWPPWVDPPKQQVLGSPTSTQRSPHVVLPLLAPTSGVCQAQMVVCGHWGGCGQQLHCWLLWQLWVIPPMQQVLGGPIWVQGVLPSCATSACSHQWGVPGPNGSVWPPGGRGTAALLALVAAMGGLPNAAGAGESHWTPKGKTMWCCLW